MSNTVITTVHLPLWLWKELNALKTRSLVLGKSEFTRTALWNFVYFCSVAKTTFPDPIVPKERRRHSTYYIPQILMEKIEELTQQGYAESVCAFVRIAIYYEIKKYRKIYPLEVIV